jgi:acetoin utilization protein AcuB
MKKLTMPTLASVLTAFPYHIDAGASVQVARELMTEHRIRHLVVMAEGEISGLLSERELQHHAMLFGSGRGELLVSDICADNIVVADLHDPLDKVLNSMVEQRWGSVVVLREGELAGIFTTTDACHHFARMLQDLYEQHDLPDITA